MSPFNTFSAKVFAASFMGLTLIPGAWTMAHTPVSNLPMPDLTADVLTGAAQRHYEAGFDDNFPMRDAFRHTWTAVKFGLLGEAAEGAIRGTGAAIGASDVMFTAEEFSAPQDTRDFATALHVARVQVEAAGAELIPVVVPDKARMMASSLAHRRSPQFAQRYDQALAIIAGLGLRSVDLRPALAGPSSFMATDTHWSPSGARASADRIADMLKDEIAGVAAFETTETGSRPFDGDLLAFAQTGAWRSLVGPAPEQIATFETVQSGGGMDLFGDVSTPIALVGTSFSARDDFHFTGFLKSSFGADVLSFAQEGRGPFVPMDHFLEGETLTTNTLQVVLWEIPERYLNTWSQDQ